MIPLGAWHGEPAFVLGGGPSLKGFDVERLRGKGRVMAINNAGTHLAPWADALYWADKRWFEWNHAHLRLHTGPLKFTRVRPFFKGDPDRAERAIAEHDIRLLQCQQKRLATDALSVGGVCGGSGGINIAWLLGADPIVLLGFDMHDLPIRRWRDGNWHRLHKKPPRAGTRRKRFIPALNRMAEELSERGARVFNATPGSALTCFPFVDIDQFLADQQQGATNAA